ncbi:MAG TPA: YbhB/YbcL family Raf kinase inhibitor-like protein [Anaerolineae bacterium]|nr:YbhB/YbcL family Raf kinase inhibitor-like protein [Anaerolineae bacterium]
MKRIYYFVMLTALLVSACSPAAPAVPEQTISEALTPDETVSISITSSAFAEGQPIPPIHACTGDAASSLKDVSPELSWSEPPAGTQSFALVMDDLDSPGGIWVHWVIFNIPASARGLPESMPANDILSDGSMNGNNSWGRTGYGGPCPPSGTHRYVFKIYALDEVLGISAGANKGELEKAMVGHILAQGELSGTFTR